MIRLRGIAKRFRDGERAVTVLEGLDLHVAAGELVAITGASGSGKSTLLHLTGGLDEDFEGEAEVAGRSLRGLSAGERAAFRNGTVGFVFQSFNLLPGLSALDNVTLPAYFRAGGPAPSRGTVDAAGRAALARVGLGDKAARRPDHLSGGERQRVAVARALFAGPRVLLADEPTGNLDALTGAGLVEVFTELAASGLAVLIATHEARVAAAAARVLHLEHGEAMVTGRGLLRLAWVNLRADRRGAILNGIATAVGAAALVFFVALGLGVGAATRQLFPREARLLEVVPASVSLGGVLGGGRLDDAAVERLKALPEVSEAYPRLDLRVPIAAGRGPEGLAMNWPASLTVQIPCVGVPRELVAVDLAPGAPFTDPGQAGPIPVVLSRRLLAIYDRAIAPSWNLRRLPPGPALIGLELPVRVGFSILPQKTEDRVFDARLVLAGLSDRTPLYAAALPLAVVRRLNQEYGKRDAGYAAVSLLVSRPEAVPGVAAELRRMGLAVEDGERALAERIGAAVALTTSALAALALLMCAVAALAIAQSLLASVRARAREIAVLQAVGATPADVRALFLAEAALTGAAGGALGSVVARLAAFGADALAHRVLAGTSFLPSSLFAFPTWVFPLGIGVAVLAAVTGALAPAAAAARADPARNLG